MRGCLLRGDIQVKRDAERGKERNKANGFHFRMKHCQTHAFPSPFVEHLLRMVYRRRSTQLPPREVLSRNSSDPVLSWVGLPKLRRAYS